MSENETIADIVAEIREAVECSSDGVIAIKGRYLADRIEAAWSRVRGIVAELAIAVRECNGEKYHVTLLRDADAIVCGEKPRHRLSGKERNDV